MMKNITIIVAVGNQFEIGLHNQLLWHLPTDLKRFKQLTLNSTVIMGKNTYLSLPVKPLPKRRNIVMTTSQTTNFEGAEIAHSVEEVLALIDPNQSNFIMGGAAVYRQFLPIADQLYLTRVHGDFQADVWFPELDFNLWQLEVSEDCPADEKNPYPHTFEIWKRKIDLSIR